MESYEKQNTLYKNREIGPYKEHFLESTLKRSAERVPHTEVFPTNDRGNLLLFYTISKKNQILLFLVNSFKLRKHIYFRNSTDKYQFSYCYKYQRIIGTLKKINAMNFK